MRPSTALPDRVFFSLAGLWFVTLTFVGFSPTFYFRALPEPLPTHPIVHGVFGLEEVRPFRKLLALTPAIALVGFDALLRRRILLLSVSSLALVWLVVWFIISDLVFLHPAGEAIIRALTRVFVW